MSYSEEKFNSALEGKRIPVLILDNKWHKLFKKAGGSTPEIVQLEKELADLLKRQGKLNNDIRALKKIKSDLMGEIVVNMDGVDNDGSDSSRKLADNKRLISESNDKIDMYEDELMELPKEIDRVNKQLMIKSMALCYEVIDSNTSEIEEIADWIHEIRIQLKKNVIRKQEKEFYNAELYSYMHDIFGPDVIDLFDMRYEPKLRQDEE